MQCPNCSKVINLPKVWQVHQMLCKAKPPEAPKAVAPPEVSKPPVPVVATPTPGPTPGPEAKKFPTRGLYVPGAVPTTGPFAPKLEESAPPTESKAPIPPIPPAGRLATQATNGLYVPARDPNFWIRESIYSEIKRLVSISQKHPVNILITGMQGTGKTSLGRQIAAVFSRPACEIQCGYMIDSTQWFGSREFSPDRGTFYRESQFVKAVETPGALILLDELNRTENPKVANSLFWLLDTRRAAWIDDIQREVRVASGVIFVATLNEGALFAGIDILDGALRDRFSVVQLDSPSHDTEVAIIVSKSGLKGEAASKLVDFASLIRKNPEIERKVSTRQLLIAAEDMVHGASLRDAVMFAVANTYGEETEKVVQMLQAVLSTSEATAVRNEREIKFI